jgi:hypothetical protein
MFMEEYKIDPSVAYDVLELPSKGIYYAKNKKTVRVAYLTAVDENILSSQNLIASGNVIDELLKKKILDKDLPIDEIIEEDRQAILIFLRNSAFGTEYTVNLTDPATKKEFTETVDLSQIKVKDFNLVANKDNEYEYTFEITKIPITFKFLTLKQENEIEKIKTDWNGNTIAPIITKQLEFMIKSIKGNRDLMNIRNLIETLPIKDSQEFRKFVLKNKPGLDLNKEVIAPSGEKVQFQLGFGVEFFRPFYGV